MNFTSQPPGLRPILSKEAQRAKTAASLRAGLASLRAHGVDMRMESAPDFLVTLRADLAKLIDKRTVEEKRLDAITSLCTAELRSAFTEAEETTFVEARKGIEAIDAQRAPIEKRIAELQAEYEERARIGKLAPGGVPIAHVTDELVYRQGGEESFLMDLYTQYSRRGTSVRDVEERLYKHERQMVDLAKEKRETFVSGMAGAVPPRYLTDMYAQVARAGRPFLNSIGSEQLPAEGIDFYMPKGVATTIPGNTFMSEGSGFAEIDTSATNDTARVQLIGVMNDISRTLFERGGSTIDRILFPDLVAVCEMAEDISGIKGTGLGNSFQGILSVSGINAVTYTDASPTVGEVWPKFSDAIQRINTGRFMPATCIYMQPRRWGWITAAVDSTGRPLFNFSTVVPLDTPMGLGTALAYGQVVGTLQGLPVVTDANIPTTLGAGTNEDIIIIARTPDIIFWEDQMMRFSFEQAPPESPGKVRLAVGRFALFWAGRYPLGIATIGGTGLVTPTF